MELGISSLGYIIEFGINKAFIDLQDLIMKSTEACLNFAEENDFEVVELVLDPPEILKDDKRVEFINLVNSYPLKKQLHGPFVDVNMCSHNNTISSASVQSYINAAKLCKEINVNIMTVHPGLGNFLLESIREINKNQLKNAINLLLDFTSKIDLTICIENMPKNTHIMLDEINIEEIFKIISHDDLFLTYDTSHFYTTDGNVKLLWERFHKKIKNIHLVENFTKFSDTHPPLGTGKVNFRDIFDIIKSYNYNGPLIIEISSIKGLQESIDFVQQLL